MSSKQIYRIQLLDHGDVKNRFTPGIQSHGGTKKGAEVKSIDVEYQYNSGSSQYLKEQSIKRDKQGDYVEITEDTTADSNINKLYLLHLSIPSGSGCSSGTNWKTKVSTAIINHTHVRMNIIYTPNDKEDLKYIYQQGGVCYIRTLIIPNHGFVEIPYNIYVADGKNPSYENSQIAFIVVPSGNTVDKVDLTTSSFSFSKNFETDFNSLPGNPQLIEKTWEAGGSTTKTKVWELSKLDPIDTSNVQTLKIP